MMVIVERKMLKIMVIARLAHLARIISHGTKIMAINRLVPVLSAVLIIGGEVTAVDGSAGDVIRNPRERNYSGWTDVGMGDSPTPVGIILIESYMQGRQKSNRLIDSIGSIV